MSSTFGSCPNGGLWYTCTSQSPTFFGCCTSDPCNGVGCPSSDLRAAGMGVGIGFDGSSYANDSSYYPNVNCKTGSWYTCAAASPSFQGCCNGKNPCSSGSCPQGDLYPAAFSYTSAAIDPNVKCEYGNWYSCLSQSTPFQGCCLSNPCTGDGGTCPSSQGFGVAAGVVSEITPIIYLSGSASSTSAVSRSAGSSAPSSAGPNAAGPSAATSSAVGTGTMTSGTPATATATTTLLPSTSSTPGPNVGLIAGAAAGGAFVGILALLVIAFFVRKWYKKKSAAAANPVMAASGSPGPANHFPSEEVKSPTPYNDEAYYPGQPIFGIPSLQKFTQGNLSPNMSQTPGPPAYQSPQRSPNRDTYVSEIDSVTVHEVGEGQSPGLGQRGSHIQRRSVGGSSSGGGGGFAEHRYGLGVNLGDVVELPTHAPR